MQAASVADALAAAVVSGDPARVQAAATDALRQHLEAQEVIGLELHHIGRAMERVAAAIEEFNATSGCEAAFHQQELFS